MRLALSVTAVVLALFTCARAGGMPAPVYHPAKPSALSFIFFKSRVPSVMLSAGFGYEAGGRVFFPAVYGVFYPAKGVARIPAGGRAARGFSAAYLFEAVPGGPPRLAAEIGFCDLFLDPRVPMIERGGRLLIRIPSAHPLQYIEGGVRLDSAYYYSFHPATGELVPLAEKPDWPSKYPHSGIAAHKAYFTPEKADLEALGLPSPLSYIHGIKNDARLRSIVIKGEGDLLLRMAIFRRWLAGGRGDYAARTLEKMKKRLPGRPPSVKYAFEKDIEAAENLIRETGIK